jgi:hypothetical protein
MIGQRGLDFSTVPGELPAGFTKENGGKNCTGNFVSKSDALIPDNSLP